MPDGVDPALLPACSPELQPAEGLRGLVDEPAANRALARGRCHRWPYEQRGWDAR